MSLTPSMSFCMKHWLYNWNLKSQKCFSTATLGPYNKNEGCREVEQTILGTTIIIWTS